MFLNYLLDLPNVLENISFNGYMQPANGITPKVLVKEKLLPLAWTRKARLQFSSRPCLKGSRRFLA